MGEKPSALTLDKKLFGIHRLGVTLSSASSTTEAKEKQSKIRALVDDTKEFLRISKVGGGLVPQSMVGTILGVSRQRVHQLVSEGVFSHWTFYGMKWLSQDEVVAFGKLHRQAGENQHKPSAKQMWKDSREAGRDYIESRRPHGY